MHTKVVLGRLVMHDIPYAFSGVGQFPEKIIFSTLEIKSYIFHAQIFSWSLGQLSTSTRLWADLVVGYRWFGIQSGVSLDKTGMDSRHMQLTKSCLILSDFQIAGLLELSHQTVNT